MAGGGKGVGNDNIFSTGFSHANDPEGSADNLSYANKTDYEVIKLIILYEVVKPPLATAGSYAF